MKGLMKGVQDLGLLTCTYGSLSEMTDSSQTTQLPHSGWWLPHTFEKRRREDRTNLSGPIIQQLKGSWFKTSEMTAPDRGTRQDSSLFFPPCVLQDKQKRNKINRRYWGRKKGEALITICKCAYICRCQGPCIQNLHKQSSKRRTFSHITCENYLTHFLACLDIYIPTHIYTYTDTQHTHTHIYTSVTSRKLQTKDGCLNKC